MFWQIRRDFISLFRRGNINEIYLDPIDGLRAISNISIVFTHLVTVFNTFFLPYPHKEWQEYLNSTAFALNNIALLSLEIFFMLSGFLLTRKLLIQWNKYPNNTELFLQKEYPLSIIKRAFRFWPGISLVSVILFIFGEPRYPSSGYLFEFFRHLSVWMFFQNYIDMKYWYITFGPAWSVSLDMQAHILLLLVLYLSNYYKKYLSIYKCLLILLLISIIRGIIVFNPTTMPVISIPYRYPPLPYLSPNHTRHWLATNYNLTFSFAYVEDNPLKSFMHRMYLPLEARFGSFIIGAMLAIKLLQTSQQTNNKPKSFKKFLFFGLICFQMLTMIQRSSLTIPPDFVLILAIASSRQLFALGQAFILFTALCPTSHPYHSPWIRKFLSLSIWIPISKLSYLVYLIHLRISYELIFGGPLRFLRTYPVTYAVLISLPIVLLISQFISCIWYVLVEKPVERAVQVYFQKKHIN